MQWKTPKDYSNAKIAGCDGLHPLMAFLLQQRGCNSQEAVERFLNPSLDYQPDPFLLTGMYKAVERLHSALAKGEEICIHGDYDLDGVSAVACLVRGLTAMRGTVHWYIPRRDPEGYGISEATIKAIRTSYPRVTLICSVDCGITAVAETERLLEQRIDLIVTDHHQPMKDLPAAVAVIDPHQPGDQFPYKYLAGVGVAYNLLLALNRFLSGIQWPDILTQEQLNRYLQFVCLGTIADVMPLLDINRDYVAVGLKEMASNPWPGIAALQKQLKKQFSSYDIGWYFAPCLNSAGRMDRADEAAELLLTDDQQVAKQLAQDLVETNGRRQKEVTKCMIEAEACYQQLQPKNNKAIVLASPNFHPGVHGLAAGRIARKYNKPTILIALKDGKGKGSGRSIPQINLHEVITQCSSCLDGYGGHSQAVGLHIREDKVEELRNCLEQQITEIHEKTLDITTTLSAEDISVEMVEQLAGLEPLGHYANKPTFLIEGWTIAWIRELRGDTLKLAIQKEDARHEAIGFKTYNDFTQAGFTGGLDIDLVVNLESNTYNGKTTVQLQIIAFRQAPALPQ